MSNEVLQRLSGAVASLVARVRHLESLEQPTYGTEPGAVSSSTSGTAGTAATISRGDHSHDLGAHDHSGAAAGGTIAHSATTGQTVNDHHNKSHAHTVADGSGAIASDQDISTTANLLVGTTTDNGKMSTGVTIQQGAADNEIIALKSSSDVAHGMTDLSETDTYARFLKYSADNGGLLIEGFCDTGDSALNLFGTGVTDNTAKSTAGMGYVNIVARKKNGTTAQAAGADANLLAISDGANTRFLFDAEGSGHADVEWIAFDDHDDLALLNRLDAAMTADPIKTEFGRYLSDYRRQLQEARIVNFYDDGPRAMLNTTRLLMLLTGACRQLGQRLQEAESRVRQLEAGHTGAEGAN